MKNIYYRQIVGLLTDRPQGLKVSTIAIHIYNQNGGLFAEEGLYQKIYESIRQFLWQQSQKKSSPFEAVEGKRGYYKLKRNFKLQGELIFEDDFQDDLIESKVAEEPRAIQMSLFDEL